MKMLAFGFAAVIALAAGCADDDVTAGGVSTNRASQQLAMSSLLYANGTYGAGCAERSGSWSVAIDGYADARDHPALSVIKDNTACVLTLTELVADLTYGGAPTIALAGSYADDASAFSVSDAGTAFYANAKLNATTFAADFIVSIIYSDDPSLVSGGSQNAGYTTVTASAESNNVPAPGYAVDLTNLSIQVDNANVVDAASGTASLSLADGAQAGEFFAVLTSDPGTSFAAIDAAWGAVSSPTAMSQTIAASAFALGGADLTGGLGRWIVILHAQAGVRSYEVIAVTFNPPL